MMQLSATTDCYNQPKPKISSAILLGCLAMAGGCNNSTESDSKTVTDEVTSTISMATNEASSNSYAIVDTGQNQCYDDALSITCPIQGDDFYGQDAQHSGHAPSYTNNSDQTIIDNVTGLVWQKTADTDSDGDIDAADKLGYEDAINYCDNLTWANNSDWQLPTIKQLYSLIMFTGIDPSGYQAEDSFNLTPFINTDFFDFAYGDTNAGERIIDAQYASSTLYQGYTDIPLLFGVNFADGRITGNGTELFGFEKTFYIACVQQNSSYGKNEFVDNLDGTITDESTKLMWSQDDSGETLIDGFNWQGALAYVVTLNSHNYLGYNDWRLPNVKELQSIVDYDRSPDTTESAAIDELFQATAIINEAGQDDYGHYWSSTTHSNWTDSAGSAASYVSFGRAMGYMDVWQDVHGAGAQRSDPKYGDPSAYPEGNGRQGDAIHIFNFVRVVRDVN